MSVNKLSPGLGYADMMKARITSYLWLVALTLLCASAQAKQTGSSATDASATRSPTRAESEAWRRGMARTPRPKQGCFVSAYPQTTWREVQCTAAPQKPLSPRLALVPSRGAGRARLATVGDGTDYSGQTTGDALTAEGSFASVTGVTSESGANVANAYTLQLNTEFFTTTACSGGQSGCQGWEQFVFYNPGGSSTAVLYIQYWMINYGSSCPSTWTSFQGDCYRNSAVGAAVPAQTIATLGEIAVIGTAPSGSADDSANLAIGNQLYSVTGGGFFPDLGQHWNTSEFNVLGPGNGSQAVFNSGSTIVVRTAMDVGTAAPSCLLEGFTAETNNLTLTGTPTVESGAVWPSVVFTESNPGTATTASCTTTGVDPVAASATTINSGNSTTLTVSPSGSGPFTYRWYTGASGNTSTPVSGGTAASLTVSPGATTSYWVLVTNSTGQVQYSQTVTITVVPSPPASADVPLPLWALGALGAGLFTLSRRKLTGEDLRSR